MVFGRSRKKSIEISCPACQGTQVEPSMAMSTYCRKCGAHLRIAKGIASLTSGPQLSGISRVREISDSLRPVREESEVSSDRLPDTGTGPDMWVKSGRNEAAGSSVAAPEKRSPEPSAAESSPSHLESATGSPEPAAPPTSSAGEHEKPDTTRGHPASVAVVFGLARDENGTGEGEEEGSDSGDRRYLGDEASSSSALGHGSMAAMISELVEGGTEPGKTNQPNSAPPRRKPVLPKLPPLKITGPVREVSKGPIRVRCFRCNHRQLESRHAESTQCNRCNTYISLANYQIRQPTDRVIRTRGNVVIHRRGSVIGSELACRNLLVVGTLSTRVDCSGDAHFRGPARLRGSLHCERLVVERGVEVECPEGVFAESALIEGVVRGNVACAGTVQIHHGGLVDGDVRAHAVDLQGGGSLTGEMVIDEAPKVILPEVKGYDPSIID